MTKISFPDALYQFSIYFIIKPLVALCFKKFKN